MKLMMMTTGGLALTLLGTGCATHKYVAKTVAPIQQEVNQAQQKNSEQDQKLAQQNQQIDNIDRDLSRTKERLADTDARANAANESARQANDAAKQADQHAGNAQQAAEGARTFAQNGIDNLSRNVQGMFKLKELKSESVLFKLNQAKLDDKAKMALDDIASSVNGMDRYVIEIQGFTDKTGDVNYNESLSQERADAVARYLANHNVPLRSITVLGVGVATGDQKTRDERAQARKVDVKVYVPETANLQTSARNQ
jgi:outer membrane protein OmpA-like peptidoglycan-associated protein